MPGIKCTIPGVNLKVFGRAIQSLSKIGDELYFEPLEDGLYLRSVNSSRSAYGCFLFSPTFFQHYVDWLPSDMGDNPEEECLRIKVGMKSVMTVFRSLSTIDKTVEKCCISLNVEEDRLVFQMYCRHGIVKTHNLAFVECETLQAVFTKDLCPNKLTTPHKLLCDAVLNFQTNQEEITLILRPDFIALKNYIEDEPEPAKVILTELTLSPEEFDHYQVGVDTDVTFCLKELRAVLSFADLTGLPVQLYVETSGKPVTLSMTGDLSFEANFVLATLAECDSSQSSTSRPKGKQLSRKISQTSGHHSKRQGRNVPHPHPQAEKRANDSHYVPPLSCTGQDTEMDENDEAELSMAMDISDPTHSLATSSHNLVPAGSTTDPIALNSRLGSTTDEGVQHNTGDDRMGELGGPVGEANQFPSLDFARNSRSVCGNKELRNAGIPSSKNSVTQGQQQVVSRNETSLLSQQQVVSRNETSLLSQQGNPSSADHGPYSPVVSRSKQLSLKTTPLEEMEASPIISLQDQGLGDGLLQETQVEDEEEVPGTPPSKKFRAVFFGTQSSTQPSQSQHKATILAPDSDDEG